uniref:Radial spoke head 3 n=1 Tax=Sinocyclocheilus anshuiensis TaxID=1608454 RepID=A0A671MX83_9TELE
FLTRCSSKANCIVKDPTHPSHSLFQLLSSGRRYRSIRARVCSYGTVMRPDPVEKRLKEQFGPKTPEPQEGRKNIDVQVNDFAQKTQDLHLSRLQLFDFDVEVQPMLQVLEGKTIEQALLEVLEEEELASLRAQQQAFKEIRDAELVEVQRLEERERCLRVEKENRIKQQKAVLEKEKETADKIAARAFAQQYLSDLLPSVYSNLKDCGYFYDPVHRGKCPNMCWEKREKLNSSELYRTLAYFHCVTFFIRDLLT